ncbi:MAG TPA: SH3 domain-containing protein [Anaerolineae bacterium]|nr:SH3 domain-containing protein [Anaerolineae bacterium]
MIKMIKFNVFIFLMIFTIGLLSDCTPIANSPAPATKAKATNVKATVTKTPSPTKVDLTEEREKKVLAFLLLLTEGPKYDPDNDFLHKYLPDLDVRLDGKNLIFTVSSARDDPVEEFVDLGTSLILAGAIISNAGEADDWGLSRIEVISPGPSNSSATLYVMGQRNLAKIANGELDIYDIMRSDVDWGDSTLAKVVVPVLNVRSGPGTNHAIIDQVSADDMLTVVRTNSTGDWLQVIIDDQGNMGWISGLPEYTQIVGSLQDVPTVQATAPPPSPTPSRQIDVDRILERIQEKQEAKLTPTPPVYSGKTSECVFWSEAQGYIGQNACIWGVVASTYKSEQAFFINFSATDDTVFYGVSFDHSWANLGGKCVVLRGLVETYEGRPEIIIRELNQLQSCSPSSAPIATTAPSLDTTSSGFEVPPGKALFAFYNFTDTDWNIDIGPYFLQVPAKPPNREYVFDTVAIDPGTYTWQAHSPGGDYYIVDKNGNRAFEFTVATGDVHKERVY